MKHRNQVRKFGAAPDQGATAHAAHEPQTARGPPSANDLLDESAAAELIGMSVSYLRMDRLRGTTGGRTPGPPFYRIGRAIRYRRSDLENWLSSCRVSRMSAADPQVPMENNAPPSRVRSPRPRTPGGKHRSAGPA